MTDKPIGWNTRETWPEDDPESRMDPIGQNGNIGIHYEDTSAFAAQTGGSHYKSTPLQPVVIAACNNLDPFQTHALKYMMRNKANPVEDIDKAIHMLEMRKEWIQNGKDPAYLLRLSEKIYLAKQAKQSSGTDTSCHMRSPVSTD